MRMDTTHALSDETSVRQGSFPSFPSKEVLQQSGLEKSSVPVAEFFRPSPGAIFSGRIFFHLGRNRAPRRKNLGPPKKKLSLRPVGTLESTLLTLGLLRFQLHFTCSATLFLSFEVHACYDSTVDFTGKKVVSVVVIFKIEVARDFYVTKQRISTSWGCLSTSRLLEESSLRRATVADGCLHRSELRGLKLSLRTVPVAQTHCPSTSRRPSVRSPMSSSIMPCLRNRAFLTSEFM